MKFLCDMGVAVRVTEWLRHAGYDAAHLSEQGLQRLPNGEIFGKARAEGRVVITFDLDFGEIAAASGDEFASVIIFRLRNARAERVRAHLHKVLTDSSDDLRKGAIISVDDAHHRVRKLPIP